MIRTLLIAGLLMGMALAPLWGAKPPPREALALQQAIQAVIDAAEPSIACVLVSRSEGYRQFPGSFSPRAPGELGAFDFDSAVRGLPLTDTTKRDLARRLNLADPDNIPEYYGSGIVLDAAQGLVLTCFHVVRDATKVYVRLPGGKGSYADIHAADARSDLAILRMSRVPAKTKAIPLGDGSKARKGDWIISLANPYASGFRDGSPSASWGIISNIRRRGPVNPREDQWNRTLAHYGALIQTDARLNLGCSGGALLNLEGELIGITTALAAINGGEAAGGFALPFDASIKRIVNVLLRGEEVEYGFLGVSLIPPDELRGGGVQIDRVSPGTPAAIADLRDRDRILTVREANDLKSERIPIHTLDDLFLGVGSMMAGTEVILEVRGIEGRLREVRLILAKFHFGGTTIASRRPPDVRGMRLDFPNVLQTPLRPGEPRGVMVKEVAPDSPAARARVFPGLVTHVNGKAVNTPNDFHAEAKKTTGPLRLKFSDRDDEISVPIR